MKIWTVVLLIALALTSVHAQAAKRLGGGQSVGRQSSSVTQNEGAGPTPAAPAQGAANAGARPAVPGAPGNAAPKRPWGGMLGGLAAGLGLAWLASALGLSEAVGAFLVFALLVVVVLLAAGWLMRRRNAAANPPAGPFTFQGAGHMAVTQTKPYRPENVGNDASARPWERSSMAFEVTQSAAGSAPQPQGGVPQWGVPAGFDSAGFLSAAKTNFVALQAAWDKSDIPALRAMMTDAMLAEIQAQLAEREVQSRSSPNRTDVVMLEARLLGIEEVAHEYVASVEFSGMIREEPSAGPSPFREVWNMTKPVNGTRGWLVAGVQALQ